MRAVQILKNGGREILQVANLPIPRRSAENHILVRNTYAGINFIDIYFREGIYKHALPMTLGKEGAGVVIEAEPHSKFKKGDRVMYSTSSGSYAQYVIVDTTAIVKIPDDISDEIAAASFIQGLTAITLVEETYKVQKGDWVLVHAAAGGMGSWLVQVLSAKGVNVIATASTDDKLQFAKANGAHHLINYKTEDVVARVKSIVPELVHVVYDGVGASTFDISLECLRRKGFLASFGNA